MLTLESKDQATLSSQVAELENAYLLAQENSEIYRSIWDRILNQGQLDEINADNFAADVKFNTKTGIISGIEALKDYYQKYLEAFTDIRFTVFDTIAQGNKLANYWRFQGTAAGTGETADVLGVTLVEMQNGKIVTEQDFVVDTFFQKS